MSGRSLTEKGRRKKVQKRAKPGTRHSGAGKIDGGKTKKSRSWFEGPPYVTVGDNKTVSTVHQER